MGTLNAFRNIESGAEVASAALKSDDRKITVTIEVSGMLQDFLDDGNTYDGGTFYTALGTLREHYDATVVKVE